ncbi:MAG: uroporphyrinogen decarboxylase family protein [Armatimonadota bacterium]
MTERDIMAHNEEVAQLWDDFRRGANRRVPITFAADEFLWLRLTGNTFREFYTDPRVQIKVLLAGDDWLRHNVVQDRRMGPPSDAWTVCPRFWMDEPECLGCDVIIQEDDFAWSEPLGCDKRELLARLRDIDPREMVQKSRLWRLYQDMSAIADGMTHRGLPVRVEFPGVGTHVVFTIAARVRGIEQLLVDMVQDPEFAHEFIGLVADRTVGRIHAWHELAGTGRQFPSSDAWGMGDDSLQFISREMYERFVLPHHRRVYAAMTTGDRHMHLCGYAQQHFRVLYDALRITTLDGPGTFVDHGALLSEMPRLNVNAQCDHTVLLLGPTSEIEGMMRRMLTGAAKQPGRFQIAGFLLRDTPPSHVRAMYEAGKRHGGIRPRARHQDYNDASPLRSE